MLPLRLFRPCCLFHPNSVYIPTCVKTFIMFFPLHVCDLYFLCPCPTVHQFLSASIQSHVCPLTLRSGLCSKHPFVFVFSESWANILVCSRLFVVLYSMMFSMLRVDTFLGVKRFSNRRSISFCPVSGFMLHTSHAWRLSGPLLSLHTTFQAASVRPLHPSPAHLTCSLRFLFVGSSGRRRQDALQQKKRSRRHDADWREWRN